MKALVLGAGVIGTATAWYLAARGHEVTVLDRREGPGLETSFANGGQISACHAEPWANPEAPEQIVKWLWRDDAPLLFRLRMDPRQWTWGASFLLECLPARTRRNIGDIVKLALYSRASLQALREETHIEYDQLDLGILHYYTQADVFESAVRAASVMREYGLDRDVKTVDEAIAIEPALAPARARIVGATYTPTDESGDAYLFTARLAAMAEARGVRFSMGRTIERIGHASGQVSGVAVRRADGIEEVHAADAYVVALGSYSPLVARGLGLTLPVYPAKGYSASVPVTEATRAPRVSLTDDEAKIVITRLGERLRIAGTAELSGYSTELNPVRCAALVRRAREFFPGAADYEEATFWTGLRPSTPSNVPLVGRTRYPNLFLNTGHGTLGWTLACGSGRALADIISGRAPDVDFRFSR
ncbi:MAG TPA: D-amino acid dehydrogenase [Usitatibacter sp.]|jgi:D-amino-acid dehydrogenase|nr:D-amino acid dehydrogenase [Usitatibacter sp.]